MASSPSLLKRGQGRLSFSVALLGTNVWLLKGPKRGLKIDNKDIMKYCGETECVDFQVSRKKISRIESPYYLD
jgi:hypothetical protein